MRQGNLPGVSAAVIQGEDVIWSRGFGFRSVEKGLPATPHTLYPIASITKSFTCAAIMQLAEQGKLSVEDPVADHIPLDIQPGGEPVRIWHLMTHTSGIPALAYAEAVLSRRQASRRAGCPSPPMTICLTFLRDAGDWATGNPASAGSTSTRATSCWA
jgi:CubicO group peptidase (beta-lactamase class C family)